MKIFVNPPALLTSLKMDGTTDDSTVLQSIIDYLNSLGGGNIILPRGTCRLVNSIILYEKINIYGSGQGITVINSELGDYAFQYITENETSMKESPKFKDVTLNCIYGIKLNSPTGGFTNNTTTQCYETKYFKCYI